MRVILIVILACLFSGCSALRTTTAEYVEKSVVENLEKKINDKLSERNNLSLDELKKFVSPSGNSIDSKQLIETIKEVSKDYLTLEGKNLVDQKIVQLQTQLASKNDLDSKSKDQFNTTLLSVLGMVSAYLGKQIVSAKKDAVRDSRIGTLEKLLNKDIDGDGVIGDTEVKT